MYSGIPTEVIKFDANKFYMISISLDKKVGFENCTFSHPGKSFGM